MEKNKQLMKKFYDEVGNKIGWDFSMIKCISKGVKWDIYDELKKYLNKNNLLLDIGTGGGEKLLKISNKVKLAIGIDISDGMIKMAKKNGIKSKTKNTRFFVMDAEQIKFPDKMFNFISCRHSDFKPNEIYRLLDEKGVFITQQVSEADKLNLKKHFKRGQNYNTKDGTAMNEYLKNLKQSGFKNIKIKEYDASEYYQTPEDLIFLLKYTPIIPNFGKEKNDFEKLDKFIKENTYKEGIKTNEKRYLIIAKK